MIYSWALRGFIYQLSSLILYHSLGDIFAILAYMMGLALLETLLAMSLLLFLALLLPPGWLRKDFGYKAFLILLIAGAASVALEHYLTEKMTGMAWLAGGMGLALLLLAGSLLLAAHFPRIRALLRGFLERLSIFTWLYVPVGIIGLLVVLVRNLG